MATIINHDLRVVDGGTVYMPPWEEGNAEWGNLKRPSVYLGNLTQEYPTGTIWRHGLRTFIYTRMDATYYGTGGGAIGAGWVGSTSMEYVPLPNLVVTATAGASTIVLERSGTTVNEFAGGFIGIKNSTGGWGTPGRFAYFQIISNTVADGDDYVTFTLDGALVLAYAVGAADCVVAANPYSLTRLSQDASADYGMSTGIFTHTTVASEYCWIQTGGPCMAVGVWATFEGSDPGSVPIFAVGGNVQASMGKTSSLIASGYEAVAHQCIGWSWPSSNISSTPTDRTTAIAIFLTIFN
ncbi:hypothetical protein LCGC14_2334180 [marine sediment metagenome]|uniref:Uncharacterized protein n=1 Tax=marine sediment metagenome TaxID=412755 RepID=A0A0F9F8Y1_9ZZZZ